MSDAAWPVVDATLADDPLLRDSHLVGLLDVLAELRARYGDHPVLLETEADFAEDDRERAALYQRAVHIAVSHGLPTLSIRVSLARLLLEAGEREAAAAQLRACEDEVCGGDESERASWEEVARASRPA
ncbi:MAG: hypothetical protein KY476_13965 [Planctomycetes bacterium]|nr:hypothetical protein [Planctomycetota bacterium]